MIVGDWLGDTCALGQVPQAQPIHTFLADNQKRRFE